MEIGSPRNRVPATDHSPRRRRSSNRPFFVPTSRRSLTAALPNFYPARQRLEHKHLVRIADRIAETITIGDALAIHIDRDVPSHALLIVQDV